MTDGIFYIVTGDDFLREATISAESVREHMPEVNIAVATDVAVESPAFDEVIEITTPRYSVADQIENLTRTPYDRTIYFDSDIYCTGDITELFDLLDNFDIALAHNPRRTLWELDDVPNAFPEFNSGVIAYNNNSEIQQLEREWLSEYETQLETTGRKLNQPALRKTLHNSELRIATIPPEYNCITWRPGQVTGKVKIFHCRLQGMDTTGPNQEDITSAVETINGTTEPRTFTQLGGITVHSNGTNSIINRFRTSLRRHGVKYTLSRVRDRIKQAI